MDIKKDDILFGPPEYIDGRPLIDRKLPLWKHLNILGILRGIFGYVRNSSGQRDNMLMCVYLSIAIFGFGIWWATHQEIKHTINIPKTKKTKKTKKSRRTRKTINKTRKTTKRTTNITINAAAPNPLPSAYYYVLFGLVLLFVVAYYARREAGRKFILKMTQTATGNAPEGLGDDLKSKMIGYVEQAVSKVDTTTKQTTITQTQQTNTNEQNDISDTGRH